MKTKYLILAILLVGIVFRLFLSSNWNFIFNMDNARDMVDVREMVVLHKLRLIGPTTAIDGVFNGPAWYYLLAIPFIITGGNPYGSIVMEIILWAVGGYFLLSLVNKYYGKVALIATAVIWLFSNLVLLTTQYAFNPNPVMLLTPVFIFCLLRYLESGQLKYSILTWLLAGIFLQFEIAAALFLPLVIIFCVLLFRKEQDVKGEKAYLGVLVFFATLIPQFLFELRNQFFLTKALFAYRSTSHGGVDLNPLMRFLSIVRGFYDSLLPTLLNFQFFTESILALLGMAILLTLVRKQKFDLLTRVCLVMIIFFVLVNLPLKVDLMRWHYLAVLVATIFLIGFAISYISKLHFLGGVATFILTIILVVFAFRNLVSYVAAAQKGDPGNSIIKNELTAVDYTYKKAQGKNFKVYVYMPSVIDYPYQYLYWWEGLKKYGYLPEDYAYLPNKPEYISQKQRLDTGSHPADSGLVFLIKEPGRPDLLDLWKNNFTNLQLIDSQNIGSITVETRKENTTP